MIEELRSINSDISYAKELRLTMLSLEEEVLEFLLEETQFAIYKGFKSRVEEFGVVSFQNKVNTLRIIESIEDERERFILVERYINGRDWEGIIEDMYYSERRVYDLHKQALESYKKVKEEDVNGKSV